MADEQASDVEADHSEAGDLSDDDTNIQNGTLMASQVYRPRANEKYVHRATSKAAH